jgi:RNA polymerase sigma-70 factor (ECF subfamily)
MAERPERPGDVERDRRNNLDGLYRRYARWLGSVLRRQLGSSPHEAEDLVQETYIRAARYTPAEVNRHPRALLHRIAVNLARDHMRRTVVRGGICDTIDDDEAAASHTVSVPPEQEYELQLKQIVLGLPPLYRDVFLLSRFTGMTYAEIASHLGISVKTVEWRMGKALALCVAQVQD